MVSRDSKALDHDTRSSTPKTADVAGAMLDTVLSHITSGVAVYEAANEGRDFFFVDFNPAAESIEHIARDEVVGRNVLDVFPGVRSFGLLEVLQRVWRTGRSEQHPVSVYHDDRVTGWRRNYVCKLPNGQIMAIYDDVTEQKRNEMASQMSEQCFRAIANYTYDWEVWVGPQGRVLWTNPAATRLTGYSIREIIAMQDYPVAIVHEEDRHRMAGVFHSAVEGSTADEVQFRIRRKDGRVVWAEMSWQPICDDKGNPLGHRESIRDVTGRKMAEKALQEAKREAETILDGLAEVVLRTDLNLMIQWANRAACEYTALDRSQIVGRHCYEIWDQDAKAPCKDCVVAKAIEAERPVEVEKSTPDGSRWRMRGIPIRDEEGHIIAGAEVATKIGIQR
jgi:PAS domain S-box-containing protein